MRKSLYAVAALLVALSIFIVTLRFAKPTLTNAPAPTAATPTVAAPTPVTAPPALTPAVAPSPTPAAAPTPVPATTATTAPAADGYDFGDFKSSTLTGKCWKALEDKDYNAIIAYATKCSDMYLATAIEQQNSLKDFAPKDTAFNEWALNDVGTSLYILGMAYQAQNQNAKAIEAYKTLVDKLSFCQCWDPKGWFWHPADAAKEKLAGLEFGGSK